MTSPDRAPAPPPEPLTVAWLLGAGITPDHRYSQQEYAGDLLVAAVRELAPRTIEGRLCWCLAPPQLDVMEPRESQPEHVRSYDDLPKHEARCEQLYKVFRIGRQAGFDVGPPAPVQVLQA